MSVAVVVGRTSPLPWAIAVLVAEYAVSLRTGVDAAAPLYAAALFACAELAYWSCDLRRVALVDRETLVTRLTAVAITTAVGALGAAAATAAAIVAAPGGGVTTVALGTASAVGVVTVLLWMSSYRPRSDITADDPTSALPNTRPYDSSS